MSPLFYYKRKKMGIAIYACITVVRHNCPMTEVLHLNGRNVKKEKAPRRVPSTGKEAAAFFDSQELSPR